MTNDFVWYEQLSVVSKISLLVSKKNETELQSKSTLLVNKKEIKLNKPNNNEIINQNGIICRSLPLYPLNFK